MTYFKAVRHFQAIFELILRDWGFRCLCERSTESVLLQTLRQRIRAAQRTWTEVGRMLGRLS
jgi:hypothetical protein